MDRPAISTATLAQRATRLKFAEDHAHRLRCALRHTGSHRAAIRTEARAAVGRNEGGL